MAFFSNESRAPHAEDEWESVYARLHALAVRSDEKQRDFFPSTLFDAKGTLTCLAELPMESRHQSDPTRGIHMGVAGIASDPRRWVNVKLWIGGRAETLLATDEIVSGAYVADRSMVSLFLSPENRRLRLLRLLGDAALRADLAVMDLTKIVRKHKLWAGHGARGASVRFDSLLGQLEWMRSIREMADPRRVPRLPNAGQSPGPDGSRSEFRALLAQIPGSMLRSIALLTACETKSQVELDVVAAIAQARIHATQRTRISMADLAHRFPPHLIARLHGDELLDLDGKPYSITDPLEDLLPRRAEPKGSPDVHNVHPDDEFFLG